MSQLSRKGWVCCALAATGIATAFSPVALRAQGVEAITPRFLSPPPPGTGLSVVAFPQTGYEGPLVLRLPASARMLGMANAGVSSSDGDAIFYNPGMLTQARGVAVSMQRYGARATAGSFGSVQSFGTYTIGIGAQVLQYESRSSAPLFDNERGAPRLSDGGDESSSSSAFSVGVGRVIKGVRVGVAAKYAEERLGATRDGVLAMDLGVSKPVGPATLALSVQNLGSGPDLYYVRGALPTRVTVGYGGGLFPVWEKWDIGMQTQLSVERDGFVRPAGGVELGYVPVEGVAFVVRSGLRLPREPDEPLATAGLGLTADRYSVDWAMEPMRGGRPVVHRLGLRIR
ncbi:PorV/PorQ family protein [Gemmatimonas sp.]